MDARDEPHSDEDNYKSIPIDKITLDADHVRRSDSSIEGLKYTITDVGLMQPIIVRRTGDAYTVIDGQRRLKALKELNVQELLLCKEVLVATDETDVDNKFRQIIANVQREDIDDIDLGHAFMTLKEQYGYQYNEIANVIGKTPHYVTSKVSLVKRLTKEVRDQAIRDQAGVKCNRGTLLRPDKQPYVMGTKVLEDIARLPACLQMQAYNDIKAGKKKKNDALIYLRSLKQELKNMKGNGTGPSTVSYYKADRKEPDRFDNGLFLCLNKIDNDLDMLAKKMRAGSRAENLKVVPLLESLLEKLNLLYIEARDRKHMVEKIRCEVFT